MRPSPIPPTSSRLVVGLVGLSAAAAASPGLQDTILVDGKSTPPPGLVEIAGGDTSIGSDPERIARLLEKESYHGKVRLLDGETPKARVNVAPFLIGKYEVTNEQYLHFVHATHRRPPEHWGQAAVQAARLAFLEAENDKHVVDRRYTRRKWDDARKNAWWRENWDASDWSIPDGAEMSPVTHVTYDDARDYCAWAGMRLPTEAEWIHAAREDRDDWFTWGDEWEFTARAHTRGTKRQRLFPVGSFERGASTYGVHDLVGSVWEWTASPYLGLEGFRPNNYTLHRSGGRSEDVTPSPSFKASMQILKGGSHQSRPLSARITTRQGANRSQATNAIGFRVASSGIAGRDRAASLFTAGIRNAATRRNAEHFDFDGVAALDRYRTQALRGKRPEGYGVVTGYDHILFAPRDEFPYSPGGELNRESRTSPVVLGFFSTTVRMAEPALDPGLYLVSYREKGRTLRDMGARGAGQAPTLVDPDTPLELLTPEQRMLRQIDLNRTAILFTEVATGEFVAAVAAPKLMKDLRANRTDEAGITLERTSGRVVQGLGQAEDAQDRLRLHVNIRKSDNRRIPFDVSMRVARDALGTGWRK